MGRNIDLERTLSDAGEQAGRRVRHYADGAAEAAQDWIERGRRGSLKFGRRGRDYGKQLSRKAEDFADEANYQYRRLRRHVNRHPVAAVAIVAGTIGAFLLLRRAFRSDDED